MWNLIGYKNEVNLCDSCKHTYPECPSIISDVIFGNGTGNDNICACAKYIPFTQSDIIYCKDCKHFVRDDVEEYTPYGFYNTYFQAFCDKHWDREQGEYIDIKLDDFCSFAERRDIEANKRRSTETTSADVE